MELPLSIADWPELWRYQYEERAAIIEFLGNRPKLVAEFIAEDAVRRMAQEEEWEDSTSYFNAIPASAEKSIAANCPARNFGYAAAAIMAALSVESGREGK